MKNKISLFFISLFALVLMLAVPVCAQDLDEIVNYNIRVVPNKDASLHIYYDIDWLVLDSDSEGPLEWVKIGIPNSHTLSYKATSDSIDRISIISSGGYYARLDLDRKYYEGEIVHMSFDIVQDNMYQVDKLQEGYTVYSFTPGWFTDAKVDVITIMWAMDLVDSWTPDCLMVDGYLYFQSTLDKNEKFNISITYPNNALNFDLSKQQEEDDTNPLVDFIAGLFAFIIVMGFFIVPIVIVVTIIKSIVGYATGSNFGETEKKITRTKVIYYPSCQGCGAVRKEGEQFCQYCGRSFVKSEEIIKEENVKTEDRDALKFTKDGEYRYNNPNTYVRVHSVVVPRPRPAYSSGRSSSHSSHHSSCAHSSCACACACACAGGGRAGCTNKDFYNTDLKLKQLEMKLRGK